MCCKAISSFPKEVCRVSRATGNPKEGTNWSKDKFSGNNKYGGNSSHRTSYVDDGKGNASRESSDIKPSPSGGWVVENTHSNKQ